LGLTAEELRARLSGPDPADPAVVDNSEIPFDAGKPLVPAAVLVGLATGPAPGVLLTRRTDHLRHHSGQVSFPGGRIDPEDASPEAAALREAREEVGLDPSHAEILGRLRDYVTGTGYRITPVLALLTPGYVTRASEHEVAEMFQLPLAVLLDPAAPQRKGAMFRGAWREYWVWPHPEQYIWGATAAILVHLARRLRGEAK
jgi:8-oxo-dGTP pyrophosphatase MutT (NUDIX family)